MKKITPKNLVCVFAHPDDEAFGPGGSIAHFVKQGVKVTIISVTNGDAEERFSGKINGDELGIVRREELKKSADILGVNETIFLDFKDGSLNNNNYHEVTTSLNKILDKIKPDTLMTFDTNGVSGHLDHVAVAMECSYLFDRLKYIKNIMYFCNSIEFTNLIGKNYFIYFPCGLKRNEVDWIINVDSVFDVKRKSMMAHKSQRKDALWLLTLFRKSLKEEYFKITTK